MCLVALNMFASLLAGCDHFIRLDQPDSLLGPESTPLLNQPGSAAYGAVAARILLDQLDVLVDLSGTCCLPYKLRFKASVG